jgi:CHAT domain-containing protein
MQRHRILSEEWENVIKQIRKVEGFSNFLRAVPFSTLRTAAAEGPVILINISNYRSDAIIIHIDKPPILVTLPKATPKHLTDLGEQLANALAVTKSRELFLPILRDLWNHIVFPVCVSLAKLEVPRRSRVWWCPTSELCALPLHAAGLYDPKKPIFDLHNLFISSYIPTLSSLISARSNMIGQCTVPKLLVIGQPSDTLPMVQDEIDNVQQLGDFVDVIVGTDASRDAVLRDLQQHSWVHFACHGHMGDDSQPFHASFELHDGHLTLLDLIPVRLTNVEFAFLAACHSAAGDSSTPDETIHLAAALQFCGFQSVVGTMWATADRAGPIISKEFYKYMFRNPEGNVADVRDSAKAPNLAIRALWKERAPLEDWVAFVHIGA